jgi:hypothetical protein
MWQVEHASAMKVGPRPQWPPSNGKTTQGTLNSFLALSKEPKLVVWLKPATRLKISILGRHGFRL